MDKKQLMINMAMVLTTVNEDPTGTIPKTPVYMVLGHDMDAFDVVTSLLVKAGLISMSSDLIKITDEGRKVAKELEDKILKKPPQPPTPQGWSTVTA